MGLRREMMPFNFFLRFLYLGFFSREHCMRMNVYLRKDLEQDYVEQIDLSYTILCRYVRHFLDAYLKNSSEGFEYLKNAPEENGIPKDLFTIERKQPFYWPPHG